MKVQGDVVRGIALPFLEPQPDMAVSGSNHATTDILMYTVYGIYLSLRVIPTQCEPYVQ